MNIAPLRKSLIRESSIFAAIIIITAGLLYYVSTLRDDFIERRSRETSSTTQLVSEKQALDTKFNKMQQNMEIYMGSQARANNPGLFLHADALKQFLNQYQASQRFSKLSVNSAPIVDVTSDPKYVRANYIVTRSNTRLALTSMSDEDVYRILDAMQRDLSGFVKIVSVNLQKKEPLTKEVLQQIQRKGFYALVDADVTFEWYGLRSTKPDSPFNQYKLRISTEPVP